MAEESNRVAEVNPEVPDSPVPAEAGTLETVILDTKHGKGLATVDSRTPPPGYETVPPELWPDADGNPPKLTEGLMRMLRGRYFTVRHPTITCGHKLDMINFPKRNCESCLFHFFNTHPQLVEVTDQFYRTQGRGPLVAMRGEKYFKAFVRYMVTIIRLKAEHDAEQKLVSREPGEDTTGTTSPVSTETSDGATSHCDETKVDNTSSDTSVG